MGLKKLDWNMPIKVKLTDHGKDIYFHQFDSLIARGVNIKPSYPIVDEHGFSTFQLWSFMMLYGQHIGLTKSHVVEDISFYINDKVLEEVDDAVSEV